MFGVRHGCSGGIGKGCFVGVLERALLYGFQGTGRGLDWVAACVG